MLTREQRITEAAIAYQRHIDAGGDPRIALWIVTNLEHDPGIWRELEAFLQFAQAFGSLPDDLIELTPDEQAMCSRSAERAHERWRRMAAQSGSGGH